MIRLGRASHLANPRRTSRSGRFRAYCGREIFSSTLTTGSIESTNCLHCKRAYKAQQERQNAERVKLVILVVPEGQTTGVEKVGYINFERRMISLDGKPAVGPFLAGESLTIVVPVKLTVAPT